MITGAWRMGSATVVGDDDASSGLVFMPRHPLAKTAETEPCGNRCPEWWTPPQPRREKRPLAVRLWQAERRAAKKLARTNERRERRSRA